MRCTAPRGQPIRIGSLFTGIGALDLGVMLALRDGESGLEWWVENNVDAWCVLYQRFPSVPNRGRLVNIEFAHGRYLPDADLVTAGFPCQGFSAAGKRLGFDDPRSGLWKHVVRIVCAHGNPLLFLENSSRLLSRPEWAERIRSDLETIYPQGGAAAITLRASDLGAPHRRERTFVLAYANRRAVRHLAERLQPDPAERGDSQPGNFGTILADADGDGRSALREGDGRGDARWYGESAPRGHDARQGQGMAVADCRRFARVFPPPIDAPGVDWERYARLRPASEPAIRRSAHGLTARVDGDRYRRAKEDDAAVMTRLRLLGNAVVPAQAALALRTLTLAVAAEQQGSAQPATTSPNRERRPLSSAVREERTND